MHEYRTLRSLACAAGLLALVASGCAPRPTQTKLVAQETGAKSESWESPEPQKELWEPHGHERLTAEARAVLDRKFGRWSLEKDQKVGQCRALWLNLDEGGDEPWRLVVLGPDNRIVASIPAGSRHWLRFVGEYDMDGDGVKEAMLSYYTGGGHCCTDCVAVATGSDARQLGGYEATHGDCGDADDRNRDGRTEFVAQDYCLAYFEGSFGQSPDLPFAYGLRNGRFVDMTAEICGPELRKIMEDGRKALREDPRMYPKYSEVRNAVNMWYVAATVLGQENDAVEEITGLLTDAGRKHFLSNMKERQERARERRKLLWTGARKDLQ